MSTFDYSIKKPLFDTTTPQPQQPTEPQVQAKEDATYSRYFSPHKGNEGNAAQSAVLMLFGSASIYSGMVIMAIASAAIPVAKWKKDTSNNTWNIKFFDASGQPLSDTNPKIKKILAEGPDRVVALSPKNYQDLLAKFPTLVPSNIQPDKQVRVWSQFGFNKAGGGWKGRIIKVDKELEFSQALDELINPNKSVGQNLSRIPFGDFGESIALDRWMGKPKQRPGLTIADTSDLPPSLRNDGSINSVDELLTNWFGQNAPGEAAPAPPNSASTSNSQTSIAPVTEPQTIVQPTQRIDQDIVLDRGGVKFNPVPQRTPQRFDAPVNGAIQGPEMLQQPVSTDLGRDAAREILDQRIPRQQIPMPDATTPRAELEAMQGRQQMLSEQAQSGLGGRVLNQPVEAPRVSSLDEVVEQSKPLNRMEEIDAARQIWNNRPVSSDEAVRFNDLSLENQEKVIENYRKGGLLNDVVRQAGTDTVVRSAPDVTRITANAADELDVVVKAGSATLSDLRPRGRWGALIALTGLASAGIATATRQGGKKQTSEPTTAPVSEEQKIAEMDARNRAEVEANDRRRARQRLQVSNTAPPAPTLPPVSAYERSLQSNPSAAAEAASTPARTRVSSRRAQEVINAPNGRMPNPKDPVERYTKEELEIRRKYDQLRKSGKTTEAERFGSAAHKKLYPSLYIK